MSRKSNQRGVVLISVLWVIAGLSLIVASSLMAARTDIQLTQNQLKLAQARSVAEAGIYWGIYALLMPRQTVSAGLPEGPVSLSWGDAEVAVLIENEAGKIDINTAPTPLIEGALLAAGVDARRVRTILENRARDKDPNLLEHNAPDDRKVRYETVEQFTDALDISEQSRKYITPLLTVHNGHKGINPSATSREILLAVPGASERQVDTYLERRQQRPMHTPDIGFSNRYFTDRLSAVYTIVASAKLGQIRSAVTSKVKLSSLPQEPFSILQWRSLANSAKH